MLTQKPENRTIRVVSTNNDAEVLSSSATYNERYVNLMFEMLDPAYCTAHPEEIQGAISAFMVNLNAALSDAGLPLIALVRG